MGSGDLAIEAEAHVGRLAAPDAEAIPPLDPALDQLPPVCVPVDEEGDAVAFGFDPLLQLTGSLGCYGWPTHGGSIGGEARMWLVRLAPQRADDARMTIDDWSVEEHELLIARGVGQMPEAGRAEAPVHEVVASVDLACLIGLDRRR